MPDAYQALESLRHMLRTRRTDLLERIGKGLQDDSYREHVGRVKELAETVEKISLQIKQINGGDDDDRSGKPT